MVSDAFDQFHTSEKMVRTQIETGPPFDEPVAENSTRLEQLLLLRDALLLHVFLEYIKQQTPLRRLVHVFRKHVFDRTMRCRRACVLFLSTSIGHKCKYDRQKCRQLPAFGLNEKLK